MIINEFMKNYRATLAQLKGVARSHATRLKTFAEIGMNLTDGVPRRTDVNVRMQDGNPHGLFQRWQPAPRNRTQARQSSAQDAQESKETTMRRHAVMAFLATMMLVFSGPAFRTEAKQIPDVSGIYDVKGTSTDGDYTGIASIQQRGEVILVHWDLDTDDPNKPSEHNGFGYVRGDRITVGVAVQGIGIGVGYTIKGSTLEGEWADPFMNPPTVFTETLTQKVVQKAAR